MAVLQKPCKQLTPVGRLVQTIRHRSPSSSNVDVDVERRSDHRQPGQRVRRSVTAVSGTQERLPFWSVPVLNDRTVLVFLYFACFAGGVMKLEPFKEVLKRQIPVDVGRPIPMLVYNIDHPKNCGNPWIGAYSTHGFWYKLFDGTNNDYEKAVALAFESDAYQLSYESLNVWNVIFGSSNFKFIVAKNQSDEVLGSIAVGCFSKYTVLGVYYVIEDCRHSGIGSKLFQEALKYAKISGDNRTIVFHSMSHLSNKCSRFGFKESPQQWKFIAYTISNPSAYPDLQVEKIRTIKFTDLSATEFTALVNYDATVTGLKRDDWLREWLGQENFNTFVAFEEDRVVGYGCTREVAGGYVLPLLVGPLYANDFEIASALLYTSLKKYYNPDDDYDWDPDVFAIYRRDVHFIVPERNDVMVTLMEKLKGETGTLSRDRLYYRSQAIGQLPDADFEKVFAVSDVHMSVI